MGFDFLGHRGWPWSGPLADRGPGRPSGGDRTCLNHTLETSPSEQPDATTTIRQRSECDRSQLVFSVSPEASTMEAVSDRDSPGRPPQATWRADYGEGWIPMLHGVRGSAGPVPAERRFSECERTQSPSIARMKSSRSRGLREVISVQPFAVQTFADSSTTVAPALRRSVRTES